MKKEKIGLKGDYFNLKGSRKKRGFDCWRYNFIAKNPVSGLERLFYIELLVVNYFHSLDSISICKDSSSVSMTGKNNSESGFVPSFSCIRVGILDEKPKQINHFFTNRELSVNKKKAEIRVGDCIFNRFTLSGAVSFTKEDKAIFPEFSSDVGIVEWNLAYEPDITFSNCPGKNDENWFPSGLKAIFSGKIILDGKEYIVQKESSYGYFDKRWGKSIPNPFIHINSSRLISLFSNKILENTAFALQGNYSGKLCSVNAFEDMSVSFGLKKKIKKYDFSWDCTRTPENDEEERLHWTVSIHGGKFVMDVDVYCNSSSVMIRDYILPGGDGQMLHVVCGGNGYGEIRLYSHQHKSLELIQNARFENVVCEYGTIN